MTVLLRRCAVGALAVLPLASCYDDPTGDARRDAGLVLAPALSVATTGVYNDLTGLRVTVLDDAGSPLHEGALESIDPRAATFETTVVFRLDEPTDAVIVAELVSGSGSQRPVEFTVRIGPVPIEPGVVNDVSDAPRLLLRGPLDNASVAAIALGGPSSVAVESSVVYGAALEGGGPASRALWRSSDPAVLGVTAISSDSARVDALAPGVAVLYAEAGTVRDSLVVTVGEAAPQPGSVVTWVGGAPGAESDWSVAANWQPARVPAALDTVVVPYPVTAYPVLSTDATIARLVTLPYGHIDIGASTLTITEASLATVHADGGSVVLIGDPFEAAGTLPAAQVVGGLDADVVVSTQYGDAGRFLTVEGDLSVDGGSSGGVFNLGDSANVVVRGNLSLRNVDFIMGWQPLTQGAELFVHGDFTIDGGTSDINGGEVYLEGDFIVGDASCSAFVADSTHVMMMYPQPDAIIDIACNGPDGNRFGYIEFAGGENSDGEVRSIQLLSDLYGWDLYPFDDIRLFGVGGTRVLRADRATMYRSVFDDVVLEIVSSDPNADPLYTQEGDTVFFVNIADGSRPQISVTHPGLADGDVVYMTGIVFDSLSSAPYARIVDSDGAAPFLWAAIGHNDGNGPARTETSGGAYTIWEGLPYMLRVMGGNNQQGSELQPLSQPLRVELEGFWDDCRFCTSYTVEWTVISGGGSLSPATSTTDSAGIAETTWTLGPTGSAQQVVARVVEIAPFGLDSVVFQAAAVSTAAGRRGAATRALVP